MANLDLIKTVEDIRSELKASTAYSNECITKQCDIGKERWIVKLHDLGDAEISRNKETEHLI